MTKLGSQRRQAARGKRRTSGVSLEDTDERKKQMVLLLPACVQATNSEDDDASSSTTTPSSQDWRVPHAQTGEDSPTSWCPSYRDQLRRKGQEALQHLSRRAPRPSVDLAARLEPAAPTRAQVPAWLPPCNTQQWGEPFLATGPVVTWGNTGFVPGDEYAPPAHCSPTNWEETTPPPPWMELVAMVARHGRADVLEKTQIATCLKAAAPQCYED